ncbi:MAG: HEAT repeat domain-containing protein, partial [Hassallia sp.]
IHRFTNEYPNVQVIVTSRVIGYKAQRLRDAEFRHFILQDLEVEQIQDFIYRWHDLTFNDEADKLRKRERLQRGIEASESIAELAGNPLLLTMMAILNRNQELPRDRAKLYNQASQVLLHQWDVERALIEDKRLDPKTIDYKDKQAMLRQVAYYMQTSEKGLAGNLISAGDLEKILTDYLKSIEVSLPREAARLMINQLRTRNFMLCFLGADYYAFVHRTFLEYFCAWEFVWQFEKTQTLTIEELKTEVFGKHCDDQTWHEVLQLIIGMIEPKFAGKIIDYLIDEYGAGDYLMNIELAVNCFLEVKKPSAITSVEDKIIEFIKNLINIESIIDFLRFEDEDVIDYIHTKAISWIATNWKTHPETLAWLKKLIHDSTVRLESLSSYIDEDYSSYMEFDKIETIQVTALQKLARGWKDDPDTLLMLKNLAVSSNHNFGQVTALQELARGWKDDPDTLPMVKNLAVSSNHNFVQVTALQELARGWKDDPDTLPMLKMLLSSSDNSVHVTALQELAQGWKDDPDTLPMLKALALSNDKNVNKRVVIEELARGWKDDPYILSILKTCFESENRSLFKNSLRNTLMQELIQGWQPNSDIYNFIYDCANDNSFNPLLSQSEDNPRQVALLAIIEQYPQHSQTLPLLRDRAENDADEKLREFAQKKLKELDK